MNISTLHAVGLINVMVNQILQSCKHNLRISKVSDPL